MTIEIVQIVSMAIATIAAGIVSYYSYRLHKVRIEFEKNARYIQERQRQILQETSEFRKHLMTTTLNIAPQVAFSSYPQLLPPRISSDMSLFDRRRSHFTPEKEKLAQAITEIISKEIEDDEKLSIILVLDAGSTVFPIFRQLCLHPTFQFDRSNARRLKMITNNLPGVSSLIRHGRIGHPVVARTLFRCHILSGYAHSQYEASLGKQTAFDLQKAVIEFKEAIIASRPDDGIKVVSVTTGNYVSIAEGILARDPNHVETKSKMLSIADYVYVLAPLGKLHPYSCKEINNLLGYSSEEGYATLPNWPEKSKDLIMVVTTRRPEYFPQLRPLELNTYFGRVQEGIINQCDANHLIRIPFDPMDDIQVRTQASVLGRERTLREYELPHQNLRESLVEKLQ